MRTRRPAHPRRAACVLLIGVSAALAPPAAGDDAEDIAAAIVRKTPNRAEAARKILDAARAMTESYAVKLRLSEEAYTHAMGAAGGYPTALAALDLLEQVAPSRGAFCRDKSLEVYRLQYYRSARSARADNGRLYVRCLLARARAGAESNNWKDAANSYRQAYQVARTLKLPEAKDIRSALQTAGSYEMVHNRIEKLRAALAANDGDLFSRKQLVMAHLVDLDRPGEAAKYLSSKIDPALHKNVTLAAGPAAGRSEDEMLALALWYQELAAEAALKHARVHMLTRALDNVDLYLQAHTARDARRLRATAMETALRAELKRLGALVARRADLPAGAVLFLTFDRKASDLGQDRPTVRDESGAKLNGKIVSGRTVHRAPRAGGTAMVFDGKTCIDMGNPPALQLTGDMTVCMWVNPARLSGRQNPMDKAYGGEGTWTIESNGTINYFYGSSGRNAHPYGGYNTTACLKAGQWTHIALVRDMRARTVTWYFNGKAVFRGKAQHAVRASPNHLLIGKGYAGGFHGMLDDVGVFTRALSADEIGRLARLDQARGPS